MNKILVVDDDKEIVKAIDIYLSKENYEILKAYNGIEAIELIEKNQDIKLVILDIMMPELDGISTIEIVRKKHSIPIILLSAKSEDYDKIEGLNIGADDYITKPFNPLELVARVNSHIRRYTNFKSNIENDDRVYTTGELTIDDNSKTVKLIDQAIKLTKTEYSILLFLTKNKGKVFSIDEIYQNISTGDSFDVQNIIAVHIRHIREKIEINTKEPRFLKVIWGIGYKIEDIKNK